MTTIIGTDASVRETVRKRWTPESGETEERVIRGPAARVEETYTATKALADAGDQRFSGMDYDLTRGRAVLTVRYGREGGGGGDVPMGVSGNTSTIEELYSVDVIKDIRQHPDFNVDGAWALTDAQLQAVNDYFSKDFDVQSPSLDDDGNLVEPSAWIAGQKRLYRMLLHGMDSYYETGFVLRRTVYGARNRQVKASFASINLVIGYSGSEGGQAGTVMRLSTRMNNLLDVLPSGEWLKKPSQCEYLGKGQWRVSEEYHWAQKWHAIYMGSLDWGDGTEA